MMAFLAFFALALVTVAWWSLPLLPAFRELGGEAMEPLAIPANHDGDARHFAKRFREYVAIDSQRPALGTTAEQFVTDGPPLRVFVASAPLLIDGDWVSPGDIYAAKSVRGDSGVGLRGLLAEENIVLGERSEVRRWIHSGNDLEVGASSALRGRASAEGVLRVGEGTSFEWLSAPRIELGDVPDGRRGPVFAEEAVGPIAAGRPKKMEGDLEIAADSTLDEDLVVTGTLRIGPRSVVTRSVKSHGTLVVGDDVSVRGSIISSGDVIVGDRCTIAGIVVAERSVQMGSESCVGSEWVLSTVSAPRISISAGSVVHGTVWARSDGCVIHASAGTSAERAVGALV
jgi:cytoskeletal protein CcmA (bactofilin family)